MITTVIKFAVSSNSKLLVSFIVTTIVIKPIHFFHIVAARSMILHILRKDKEIHIIFAHTVYL